MKTSTLADLLLVAGVALVAVGFGLVYVPAGLIVLGVAAAVSALAIVGLRK